MVRVDVLKRVLPLILSLALLPGCMEELIKSFYPVTPTDGEVGYPDGAIGFDGEIPHKLLLKAIKPAHGPFAGGTEVVLSGSGFTKKVKVRIGGTTLETIKVTLLSPVSLKVITPAGKVGLADVEVILGSEKAKLTGAFTYDPVYLDPDSGPAAGGTLVTVHGKDTAFKKGMTLTLGGKALTDVEVISTSAVRAKTPAGTPGPAPLVMGTAGGDKTITEAYTYYQSANQKTGGMGGGKLAGTLTVDVLDWLYRSPVDNAKVVVQKGRSFTMTATTTLSGVAVFSSTKLKGKVSVTVAKKGYEATSMVSFDARDLTVFLLPIPNPQPGPMPPGQSPGIIRGHLLFGGATGVGSPHWKLVPAPKTNQVKRAYVFTSVPRIAWGPPTYGSGHTVDFDKKEAAKAWPFSLYARTGAMAIWAVAGIYDKSSATFEPYAMGVTRGVVVGPGDVAKADIWVTIPLTQKVDVVVKDVPAGVSRFQVRHAIDLGADGLLMRMDQEVKGDGIPASYTFGRLPTFLHKGLLDASHTVEVMLDTGQADGLPMTRATERLVQPKGGAIVMDKFLGVPRQVKPAPGAKLQGNTVQWSQNGVRAPNLSVTILRRTDETPVWRVFSPGSVTAVKLPDPKTFGLPPWPKAPVVWLQYLAYLPGFSFDTYTYYHLSSRYWSRWSYDEFSFKGP